MSKTTYSWGTLYKYGKMRVIEILGVVTIAANTPITTFSSADAPIDTLISPLSYGNPYTLGSARIGSNGDLTLRDQTDATPAWSNMSFRGQVVWFVA